MALFLLFVYLIRGIITLVVKAYGGEQVNYKYGDYEYRQIAQDAVNYIFAASSYPAEPIDLRSYFRAFPYGKWFQFGKHTKRIVRRLVESDYVAPVGSALSTRWQFILTEVGWEMRRVMVRNEFEKPSVVNNNQFFNSAIGGVGNTGPTIVTDQHVTYAGIGDLEVLKRLAITLEQEGRQAGGKQAEQARQYSQELAHDVGNGNKEGVNATLQKIVGFLSTVDTGFTVTQDLIRKILG